MCDIIKMTVSHINRSIKDIRYRYTRYMLSFILFLDDIWLQTPLTIYKCQNANILFG